MAARHFVRAGFVVAALSVAGASNLHANQVTNEECTEAWESSAASASCTGTAQAEYGNDCWVDADCDNAGVTVPWSVVRPLDEISQLSNCDGEPAVGECSGDEEPSEEPEQTLDEQCTEAWESSAASATCTGTSLGEYGNECWVDADCDNAGVTVPWSVVRPLDEISQLSNCDGEPTVGECSGDEEPSEEPEQTLDEQCTEAWESSAAFATCTGTSLGEDGNYWQEATDCSVEANCDNDGVNVPWFITRPLVEISLLSNCEGMPTVGECSDDGDEEEEEEQTLEEACREAWESSPSAEACVERAITERPNDTCRVDLNCTQDDGRVMRAIATWTTDKLAQLHYCQGPWLQPLPCNPTIEEQCIYNWNDSEASETCEATVTADGADWCEVDAMCQKEGYVVSDTISRPPAQIPQLKNCLGTLTVGQCPGE